MKIPIVGPSYRARSRNEAADTCINLYPEVSEINQEVRALYGTPGCRTVLLLDGTGPVRGLFTPAIGKMIAVQGDSVYRVDGNMTQTLCTGSLLTITGQVSIAENGTVAVIVDGNYGYVLDLASNAVVQITDPAFYGADKVGFIDGYFIFNKPDTQQFYISSLYGTNFDALDFASAEGAPDKLISLLVDHREVWMFGESTTEVFYNSGNGDFPIERITGAYLEHGCAAAHSVAKLDNTVFWLGRDNNGRGMVWRANGYSPQRISTHALEYAIQTYGVISDAIAYTYQADGHSFYVLTFPSASVTWCYDAATGLWHQRAWWDAGDFYRHRSNCITFFANKHLVGDFEDGRVYWLDPDYYMDDSEPLVAQRAAPVVSNDEKLLYHRSIEIIIESGVGTTPITPVLPEYVPPPPPPPITILPETAAIAACYETYPSDERLLRMDAFITSLIADGIWAKLDSMYVPMGSGELHGATCDWIRTSIHCVLYGNVTWDNSLGFVGDGNPGSKVDSLFNFDADGVNYTSTNASIGMWITADSTQNICVYSGVSNVGAANRNVLLKRESGSGGYIYRAVVNSVLGSNAAALDLEYTDAFVVARRLNNSTYLYEDAALNNNLGINPRTTANLGYANPDAKCYILATYDATQGVAGELNARASFALWYAGASLDAAEQTAFRAAINTYLYG